MTQARKSSAASAICSSTLSDWYWWQSSTPLISRIEGKWLTIGDPPNYLKTVIEYALDDAEMRARLEPRIRGLLKT